MQQHTRSLIEELDHLVPHRDKHVVIESRVKNLIENYINIVTLIRQTFNEQESIELQKRLLNSLKNEDNGKFVRKIREMKKQSSKVL